MSITIVTPSDEEQFEHYYEFRWRLLRDPWGQPKGSEKDEYEGDSYHLMAVEDSNEILGVGRLHFNSEYEAQVRYMAVAQHRCRQGIGTAILEQLEQIALQNNAQSIVLNARSDVVDFYRKYGYQVTGRGKTLFDSITHVKMRKIIEVD